MYRTAVINVVGLTRNMLGGNTPELSALGPTRDIEAIVPALTCSTQTTYLTGTLPARHGIVGNGWYFRELDQVWLWRQSNRLIQAPRIWNMARERDPAFRCANTFWWYAMATDVDITLTPRPLYCADGLKLPDFYTQPGELRAGLKQQLGQFPLFEFWGPRTSIRSSRWIAEAALEVERRYRPDLNLIYLPHLDYCLQRLGPKGGVGGGVDQDLRDIDAVCGSLIRALRANDVRVIVLSEYGIVPVDRPVHVNRHLRQEGWLEIKHDLGRDYLDTGASRAFAVADHQIAHVYVRRADDIGAVRALCERIPGVAQVLDRDGKCQYGLDHERAGDLVLLSRPEAWFTYYFWLDDDKAPDYARTVDIHNKPGYDPVELFVDPRLRFPRLKAASVLARKALGMRYTMDLIPLDANLVKGSHGLPTVDSGDGPVFISSQPEFIGGAGGGVGATDVCSLMLDHLFSH